MLPIMYTSVKYTYITNTTVLKKYWQLCLEANSILYDSMTAEYYMFVTDKVIIHYLQR